MRDSCAVNNVFYETFREFMLIDIIHISAVCLIILLLDLFMISLFILEFQILFPLRNKFALDCLSIA